MTAANDNVARPGRGASASTRPCPICGRPASDSMRPFCSKRCADVDLHRWLGGRYGVPADPDVDEGSSDGLET